MLTRYTIEINALLLFIHKYVYRVCVRVNLKDFTPDNRALDNSSVEQKSQCIFYVHRTPIQQHIQQYKQNACICTMIICTMCSKFYILNVLYTIENSSNDLHREKPFACSHRN